MKKNQLQSNYTSLGRCQESFEDTASEKLTYSALPIAVCLGMSYKNWHLKKSVPKKIAALEIYREALRNNEIPLGAWSEELFGSTTESSHAVIRAFITTHAQQIVQNPHRLLSGGNGPISPVTFAGILMAGFIILNKKVPNKRHVSLADLQLYLDTLHKEIRSSHVVRFVNGIGNKDWYVHEDKKLKQIIPDDKDRMLFKRFLAVTAMLSSANSNATFAIKAFVQYKRGVPFSGFLGTVISALNKIVEEGSYSSDSTKTVNYTDALQGDTEGVAVDRWLTQQFGAARKYRYKGRVAYLSPSVPLQRAIKSYVQTIASYTDLQPVELHAMMWFAERTRAGNKTDRSYATTLRKKLMETMFPHPEFKV